MSWDVIVMKFPQDFNGDLENLPDDFKPENICTREYFENEIKKIFPKINCETLNEDTFSIEFDIGEGDPIQTISLQVRGDNKALESIKILCERFNCQELDTTKSEIIDFIEETNNGFMEWQEYRDKVVQKKERINKII
jgi:hypothetical protein